MTNTRPRECTALFKHNKDCLCFSCIAKSQNIPAKASLAIQTMDSWLERNRSDWITELYGCFVYPAWVGPLFNQGLTKILLERIIAQNQNEKTQQLAWLAITAIHHGISDYSPLSQNVKQEILQSVIKFDGMRIFHIAMKSGTAILRLLITYIISRITCEHSLEYDWEQAARTCVFALQIHPTKIRDDLRANPWQVKCQAMFARKTQHHYTVEIYEKASMALVEIIREKSFTDSPKIISIDGLVQVLAEHSSLLFHNYPSSKQIYCSSALLELCGIPKQLEDDRDEFEQKLFDMYQASDSVGSKLVIAILEHIQAFEPDHCSKLAKIRIEFHKPGKTVEQVAEEIKTCLMRELRNLIATITSLSFLPEHAASMAESGVLLSLCAENLELKPREKFPVVDLIQRYEDPDILRYVGIFAIILRNLGQIEYLKEQVTEYVSHPNYVKHIKDSIHRIDTIKKQFQFNDPVRYEIDNISSKLKLLPREGDIDAFLLDKEGLRALRVKLLLERGTMGFNYHPIKAMQDIDSAIKLDPQNIKIQQLKKQLTHNM
jgi:hypothetical protein